ncbi:GspH/FimT family protein [Thermus thermophilus]|uniref:Prepilin-type N-terminal cleavage/methylation domain-containing protein n=1 Tax=Thermus thermophilus JL-18 TaxID=798128 RepID=H9ZQX7_THETH|nr:GspH/FimT family protein [Thermus thermophilus]AFH38737.1 prepilin-type N-terminal cleavage/methylation domain-containing protein [Thermus thermophilus JL-18]
MRKPHGLSLIELVIVLAVLGVLLALGTGYLRSDRLQVNQAARSLAAQVTRARLEAIRRNDFVGIQFLTSGTGGYVVFVDQNRNGTYDAGDTAIQTVNFGQGEWARVRLTALAGPAALVFDPRGIPQDFTGATVTLSDRAGTYTKGVSLSPQGRASLP